MWGAGETRPYCRVARGQPVRAARGLPASRLRRRAAGRCWGCGVALRGVPEGFGGAGGFGVVLEHGVGALDGCSWRWGRALGRCGGAAVHVPSSVLIFVTLRAVPEMRGWCYRPWFEGKDTPGPFPSALQRQGRSQPAPWWPSGCPVGRGAQRRARAGPGGSGHGVRVSERAWPRCESGRKSHRGRGGGDTRSQPPTRPLGCPNEAAMAEWGGR